MINERMDCSFCGSGLSNVDRMVKGICHEDGSYRYICDKCIKDCKSILENERLSIQKVISFK